MLTLMMVYQPAGREQQLEMRPNLMADARDLTAMYGGPNARQLLDPAGRGQTFGWVMTEIAWRCENHGVALDILDWWEGVAPKDPILHAERAQVLYFMGAYRLAMDAAAKAKACGLNDPDLLKNA